MSLSLCSLYPATFTSSTSLSSVFLSGESELNFGIHKCRLILMAGENCGWNRYTQCIIGVDVSRREAYVGVS